MKLKTKPSGIYFIDFAAPDDSGGTARRRVSLDTRDLSEARQQMRLWMSGKHPKQLAERLTTTEGLVSRTSAPQNASRWTVDRALDACLSDKEVWSGRKSEAVNRSMKKELYPLCGEDLVADLTYERVKGLIEQMRGLGLKPGTIARRLSCLSMAVSMSMIWKDPKTGKPYLSGRPKWPTVKVDNIQERVVSFEEEAAIFEAIDRLHEKQPRRNWWHYKCLVRLLLDTGLRMGEALRANRSQIHTVSFADPRTGLPRVATFIELPRYSTKSDKPRRVPLSQAVVDLLPALSAQAARGKLFPWEPGSTTVWQYWQEVRTNMAEQGWNVADVKQHTFRHTCATRLARGGMGLQRLKEWLGHHDIKITEERYGHLCAEDLVVGLDIMEQSYRIADVSAAFNEKNVEQSHLVSPVKCADNGTAHLH